MKEVTGSASNNVPFPVRRCYDFLAAVDEYPSWVGEYVRHVKVLKRDSRGDPTRARAAVHVAQSPFGKDFILDVEVSPDYPGVIRLRRIPAEDDDRLELVWRLEPGAGTTVTLEFAAEISVLPAWLPVGDAGDTIAHAVLKAAARALQDAGVQPGSRSRQRA